VKCGCLVDQGSHVCRGPEKRNPSAGCSINKIGLVRVRDRPRESGDWRDRILVRQGFRRRLTAAGLRRDSSRSARSRLGLSTPETLRAAMQAGLVPFLELIGPQD
jgi:hypothetical protein